MGGLDPARDYVLRAMRAGQARRHRQQAAALPARRGAVGGRARARRAAALRGRRRRRRAGRSACCRSRSPARTSSASTGSSTARRTSSSREMAAPAPSYDDALRRGPAARLRRGRPDRRRQRQGRGGQDGDPRAAGVRHAGAPRRGPLRGHRAPHRRRPGVRARARPRAEAASAPPSASTAACRVRVHPAFLYAGHPLASRRGPVQRGDGRVRGDHRDHAVGARAPAARRPRAPCSATSSA